MIFFPNWYDNIPFYAAIVAALLYYLGGRQRLQLISRSGVRPARSTKRAWRSACFYSALVILVFALQPPLDGWADSLLWVHMIQHELLLMVAAPLLVIAAPWLRIWAGFSLALRRPVARSVVQGGWARPLRGLARWLGLPVVAWTLFNVVMIGWHVPLFYDAAVQNQPIHDSEHLSFLLVGLLFWGQLFDSPPFHSRLDYMHRFFFMATSMFPSWVLALILVFSGAPLYPVYVVLESGHSGLGALADQELAGGIMWMIGSIPMAISGFWLIYQWASDAQEPGARRRRRRVGTLGIADESSDG
ncbi:MAG: cytochrome c oxidase assembly protein [Candidatus Dormiibacterota bacterium]